VHIDWRQAQRWGIDEKMIPAGTVIHYKQPTFWEMYRTGAVQTSADAADLILQSGGDRHADLIRIVTRIRNDTCARAMLYDGCATCSPSRRPNGVHSRLVLR
jgi:hypothetical protein